MSELTSVWAGSFSLFGIEIHCHVLDDGRRVIEADSVAALFDRMAEPDCFDDPGQLQEFIRWQREMGIPQIGEMP